MARNEFKCESLANPVTVTLIHSRRHNTSPYQAPAQLTYRRHVFPPERESRLVYNDVGVKAQVILRHVKTSMHQNVFLNRARIVFAAGKAMEGG